MPIWYVCRWEKENFLETTTNSDRDKKEQENWMKAEKRRTQTRTNTFLNVYHELWMKISTTTNAMTTTMDSYFLVLYSILVTAALLLLFVYVHVIIGRKASSLNSNKTKEKIQRKKCWKKVSKMWRKDIRKEEN